MIDSADLLTTSATEYLRLGQNDDLQVIEQKIDEVVRSVDSSGRAALLDEVEKKIRGVAQDVSPDDADRLEVLLEVLHEKRQEQA